MQLQEIDNGAPAIQKFFIKSSIFFISASSSISFINNFTLSEIKSASSLFFFGSKCAISPKFVNPSNFAPRDFGITSFKKSVIN